MQKTNISKGFKRLLGMEELGVWDKLTLLSLALAAIAALAVVFTTLQALKAQKAETEKAKIELEEYKLTVEGKVADAKKEGIEAGRAANDASLRAAEANERAAKAELELEKYRAGRLISPEQHATMVATLATSPKGRVVVKPNFLNSEATRFANQISSAFNEAGFSGVGDAPLEIVSYNRPGLFLAVRDGSAPPPHTRPIINAFSAAGIPIEVGNGNWVPDTDTVVILVSERP